MPLSPRVIIQLNALGVYPTDEYIGVTDQIPRMMEDVEYFSRAYNRNIIVIRTNSLSFEAKSAIIEELFIISISRGVCFKLTPLMSGLLSHEVAFPEFIVNPIIPQVYPNEKFLFADEFVNYRPPVINCPTRARLTIYLSSFAEWMIFFHEAAHITNGHLSLLSSKNNTFVISETASLSNRVSGIRSQTLEWDADCAALQLVVQKFVGGTPRREGLSKRLSPPEGRTISEIRQIIKCIAFASYIVFRMFHENHYELSKFLNMDDIEALKKMSHPPSYVRAQGVSPMIDTIMTVGYGYEQGLFLNDAISGIVEAEKSWSALTNSDMRSPFQSELLQAGNVFVSLYEEEWKSLRPILEPHAFTGRLAP